MISYKDCPECGARKIHSTVRLCEVCETCEKYESKLAGEAAHIKSLEGLLVDACRERDELQAKLDAELPAAWREDLASLNECLDRVGRERDEARAQLAALHAHARALCVCVERIRRDRPSGDVSMHLDTLSMSGRCVEDAIANTAAAEALVRERDEAQERERLAKMIASQVQSERDEARAEVERLRERIATQDDGLRFGEQVCARLVDERDEAKRNARAWSDERDSMRRERDEVRAEVAHEREVANEHLARRHDAERERDEARAEVERLQAEVKAVRAALRASPPRW